jgi:hypothetical protein
MEKFEKNKNLIRRLKKNSPSETEKRRRLAAKRAIDDIFGKERENKKVKPLTSEGLDKLFGKNK